MLKASRSVEIKIRLAMANKIVDINIFLGGMLP